MNYFTKIIIFVLLLSISDFAIAQKDSIPKHPFKNKLYTGGGVGLQIGDVTLIEVSPILGYNITKNLSIGIGASYQFMKIREYNISSNTYGGSVFGRYTIWRNIFAHAEYELLNFENIELYNNVIHKQRMNVSSLFVGGGYRQMIGENSAMVLLVLWNLNETPYTPYTNPVLRVGVEIGL